MTDSTTNLSPAFAGGRGINRTSNTQGASDEWPLRRFSEDVPFSVLFERFVHIPWPSPLPHALECNRKVNNQGDIIVPDH